MGDLEITLVGDEKVITSYEMKTRRVTVEDIDRAIQKINSTLKRVDNYIFITTDVIDEHVREYASSMHEGTGEECSSRITRQLVPIDKSRYEIFVIVASRI